MRLGIMQPYFFPYVGYFSLIAHTDKWVVFDTVQFIRHGWIERNRILKPGEGWQYFSVPLRKHSRGTKICELEIRNVEDWRGKIIRQLEHYRKRAPYYEETLSLVRRCLDEETNSLVELNVKALSIVCEYLQLPFVFEVFSESKIETGVIKHPGQWALKISEALGATEYVNPPGGADLFDPVEFKNSNITLSFLKNNLGNYDQKRPEFEPGLSIIDVLMFNSRDEVIERINDTAKVSMQ